MTNISTESVAIDTLLAKAETSTLMSSCEQHLAAFEQVNEHFHFRFEKRLAPHKNNSYF
jgi:hypothetical protein